MRVFLIFWLCISYHICTSQTFIEQDTMLGIVSPNTVSGGQGGLSFVDFNNDGYDDLTFCTHLGFPLYFFENKKSHFEQVFFPSITTTEYIRQALWVDVENDGDKDLYVTTYNTPNKLYINDGNFNFTESSASMGLSQNNTNSTGITFGDLNKDGYLDFYVSNTFNPNYNEIYVYLPATNMYENITLPSGASGPNTVNNVTFCSSMVDFDFDGDLDIYTSNDGQNAPNAMFRNNGDLTFTDIAASNGSTAFICSMNTATADYNNDGFWDIYCTNKGISKLLKGNGLGTYTDEAGAAGVSFNRWGWAGNFADFDNDGYLDLYVSGQYTSPGLPNALYMNNQNGTFTEPFFNTDGIAGRDTVRSFSNAVGDFNNDGKIDIAVSDLNLKQFRLYTNYEENNNEFIKIDLVGVQSNIEGIGAVAEVWHNNAKRIFQVHSSNGIVFQNSETLHIGFENQVQVDSVVIKWPYANNKSVIPGTSITSGQKHLINEFGGLVAIESLEICKDIHEVIINPIPSQAYHSVQLTKSSATIEANATVVFRSETEIELEPDFEVKLGAEFLGEIGNCH